MNAISCIWLFSLYKAEHALYLSIQGGCFGENHSRLKWGHPFVYIYIYTLELFSRSTATLHASARRTAPPASRRLSSASTRFKKSSVCVCVFFFDFEHSFLCLGTHNTLREALSSASRTVVMPSILHAPQLRYTTTPNRTNSRG